MSTALLDRLPVKALEEQVKGLFASQTPVVLTSPPGSGKSTLVPLWGCESARRVLVVEPRRVACRSLARFLSRERQSELGQAIGYAIRHEDKLCDATEVAFITPGIALRMLASPTIDHEQLVIIDEFHERSLEMDLILATLLAREHPRLAVLSATLDGQGVARHIRGQHLRAEGRQYPIEVEHIGDEVVPSGRHLAQRVAQALTMLRDDEGDVLVFLPGKGEIAACRELLARDPVFEAVPLHAELATRDQDRAFDAHHRRRAVLSTNVAETSVTLPGVRAVIDSGLVRRTTYRDGRGALSLLPIARDSADQRAGRAGRVAAGRCLRLWHGSAKLSERTPAAILREDLSQLVLSALELGHDPKALPWLDAPRDFALEAGTGLLVDLGIASSDGPQPALTAVGRKIGRLPVDPVLGRLLLSGAEHGVLGSMILLVSSLAAERPLFVRGECRPPEDERADPLTEARCDASARIVALSSSTTDRRIRPDGVQAALRIARQLARLFDVELAKTNTPPPRELLIRSVVAALPDSPFARRPRRNDAWGNGKVELQLERDTLVPEEVQTVVVVDQHHLADSGRALRRIGTCAMPAEEHLLRTLGAGSWHPLRTKVEAGSLVAELEWRIGTRALHTQKQIPEGEPARQALHKALLEGRVFAETLAHAKDEIAAFNLRCSLEREPPLDFEAWVSERIAATGFASGDELPLLNESDFQPQLLSSQQKAELDQRFPRKLVLAGLTLSASYDPKRREVIVEARGKGVRPPRNDLLPRWPGWRVLFSDGKKKIVVRER